MNFTAKRIVSIGLMASISIVLARLLSFMVMGMARISFGDVPIMLSGMLFGPLTGAATGILSDIVGVLLLPSPGGASYIPGMTLSKALVGIIPALAIKYIRGSDLFKTVLAVVATEIVCSMVLDTIWLSPFYGNGIIALAFLRVPIRFILMLIEIPVIYELYKSLRKVIY